MSQIVADTGVDRDAHALGVIFHLREMRGLEAFEIIQARELDGVELQAGGVIDELDVFPLKIADGESVEPQPDTVRLAPLRRRPAQRPRWLCRNVRRSISTLVSHGNVVAGHAPGLAQVH